MATVHGPRHTQKRKHKKKKKKKKYWLAYKLFCYSVFNFQQNKRYPNRP